jgi:enoyl-CoA hydratase/carnithine racemase
VSIEYELRDATAEIVLDRPEKLNALTLEDVGRLSAAFDRALADGARAVLLRAVGRAFCVGRDLAEMRDDEDVTASVRNHFNALVVDVDDFPVPVVAAIQGPCVGAGTGLALACDVVIAAESASFASPFGRLGAIPDAGFHWFVTTRLGPAMTKDMILTGRALAGQDAARTGLVSRCVADDRLLDESRAVAAEIAAGPTTAFGMSLELVDRASRGSPLLDSLEQEAVGQGRASRTADFAEGRAAFLGRRQPQFSGR